jgi:large subunit ribosomal protein L21
LTLTVDIGITLRLHAIFGGNMYAVVRTGGKQYKVQPGDTIRVEKLEGQVGSEIILKDILLVGGEALKVGAPQVTDAEVSAIVLKQAKFPKVIIFKKKRRQGYRRTKGHRQPFTELFIKSVAVGGNKVEASEVPSIEGNTASKAEKTEKPKKASAKKAATPKKVATPKKATTPKKAAAQKKEAAPKKAAEKTPGKRTKATTKKANN